jgi:cyclomaltodextrinase / maltogenic alpha-amylase / neopullulanase
VQRPPDSIFWHVYPLGFCGAEKDATDGVRHRLGRIVDYLDHARELGASGLLLGPVFASASHGYDTLDHYRIDERLGDGADFDALAADAHAAGFCVVLDGVFNHLGRDHELVRRALDAGPGTPDGDWIRWSGAYPYFFEGHEALVALNLSNPAVQDYVAGVMSHWLRRGIDGWRLDAAYAAGPDAWAPIVARVRAAHPDAWLLGEVLHGDYAGFVAASGLDTVTQYELWKATWSSLNDANLFELAWTLTRHDEMVAAFRPQTFIGNHDVTRIATKLTDPRHVEVALALLMLLPGTPSIYYGDELGFTGEKLDAAGGDDAIRPEFPADPAALTGDPACLDAHRRLIGLRRNHPWLADARLTTGHLTNTTLAIGLAGRDGQHLTLGLNLGDDAIELPGSYGPITVHPQSWALG